MGELQFAPPQKVEQWAMTQEIYRWRVLLSDGRVVDVFGVTWGSLPTGEFLDWARSTSSDPKVKIQGSTCLECVGTFTPEIAQAVG